MVDGRNTEDLALLDTRGFDTWRGNRGTKAGDLVLMYRTAPYSDIAYIFRARSDARPTKRSRNWQWHHAIDLSEGYRLQRALALSEMKREPALTHWSFLTYQQGIMNRKKDLIEEGVWPRVRQLLEARGRSLPQHFASDWTSRSNRLPVFLSYSSNDKARVQGLYEKLISQGLDVWLDRADLEPGIGWEKEIDRVLKRSLAFVVCVTPFWLKRFNAGYYVQKELDLACKLSEERGRFLFPVLFGSMDSKKLPKELVGRHWVTLNSRGEGPIDRLTDVIRLLRPKVELQV
jgi:hypothetical protein